MAEKIISKKDVEKVADLARMAISEDEKSKMAGQLSEILVYFQDIQEVDTENVEAFDHYDLKENQLRGDEKSEASDDEKELIRENFPDRQEDFLKVKKVLKGTA